MLLGQASRRGDSCGFVEGQRFCGLASGAKAKTQHRVATPTPEAEVNGSRLIGARHAGRLPAGGPINPIVSTSFSWQEARRTIMAGQSVRRLGALASVNDGHVKPDLGHFLALLSPAGI